MREQARFESLCHRSLLRAIFSHPDTAAHSPHTAAAQYADHEFHETKKRCTSHEDFNEYAEATLGILGEETSMTPTKLLYIYTALKAFVVPLRSFRFISYNFLLVEVE